MKPNAENIDQLRLWILVPSTVGGGGRGQGPGFKRVAGQPGGDDDGSHHQDKKQTHTHTSHAHTHTQEQSGGQGRGFKRVLGEPRGEMVTEAAPQNALPHTHAFRIAESLFLNPTQF